MITRLAWRLSGLAVDLHPSDGDSTKVSQGALYGRVLCNRGILVFQWPSYKLVRRWMAANS
jgi:hypothetical protein